MGKHGSAHVTAGASAKRASNQRQSAPAIVASIASPISRNRRRQPAPVANCPFVAPQLVTDAKHPLLL
jgi:hypothetical protein